MSSSRGLIVCLTAILLSLPFTHAVSQPPLSPQSGAPIVWQAGAPLRAARYYHTSTLLEDGRVFVTGGRNGRLPVISCELFDPSENNGAGQWLRRTNLHEPRERHTATMFPTGAIVVTGGLNDIPLKSCEVIDPIDDVSILIPSMNDTRYEHTATYLGYGRILVTGSKNYDKGMTSCEIFEPQEFTGPTPMGTGVAILSYGVWRYTGSMKVPRGRHTATLLHDDRVLVTGGVSNYSPTASCEAFDKLTHRWTQVAPMNIPRAGHTATLLPDGRVIVTGGKSSMGEVASAEIFDPTAQGGLGSWRLLRDMNVARFNHAATYHPSGVLLVTGTWVMGQGALSSELLTIDGNVMTNSWTQVGDMLGQRSNHTSTLLHDGRVLVIGGEVYGSQDASTGCEYTNSLGPLAVDALPGVATDAFLHQNIPNPFSGGTNISFTLSRPASIRLFIVDMLGREVAMLADGWHGIGTYSVDWDGVAAHRMLPSGSYLIVLHTGRQAASRLMTKVQ